MVSLLRAALEGELDSPVADEKELMELKGPLSEVFSQALNQVYARPDKPPADTDVLDATAASSPPEDPSSQSGNHSGAVSGQQSQALESQANDALAFVELINNVELASAESQSGNADTTVYGVSAADVKPEDIVEVSQDLAQMGQHGTGAHNYVVVIDATQPSVNGNDSSNPEPRVVELAQALEGLVHAYGARVYPSLEAFAKDWVARRRPS